MLLHWDVQDTKTIHWKAWSTKVLFGIINTRVRDSVIHSQSCAFSVMSDSETPPVPLPAQWTVACKAPLCMGFPRQEYWSGLHFLLQGCPDPGSDPGLLHQQASPLPAHRYSTWPVRKKLEMNSEAAMQHPCTVMFCISLIPWNFDPFF